VGGIPWVHREEIVLNYAAHLTSAR
jgi:hypothetical protein